MGRRVLILAAGIGSGHNMAASVLEECFGRADGVDEVRRLDVLDSSSRLYRSFYDDGYFKLVEAVPWLVGWGYDAGDPPFKLGNSISLLDRLNTTATVRAIRAFDPHIIVCTHFLPARLVSLLLARGSLAAELARRDHRLRLPGSVAEQSVPPLLRGPRRDEGAPVRDRCPRPTG